MLSTFPSKDSVIIIMETEEIIAKSGGNPDHGVLLNNCSVDEKRASVDGVRAKQSGKSMETKGKSYFAYFA